MRSCRIIGARLLVVTVVVVASAGAQGRPSDGAADLFARAAGHAEAGHFDKALAAFRESCAEGYETPMDVLSRPAFAALQDDARARRDLAALLKTHARQWRATIVREDEPGERIVIGGRVLDAEGSPIPGTLVYLYHTDARGIYAEPGGDAHPRLFAWLRTDEEGRYEYTTIKPASYPNTNVDQHVHYELTAEGFETRRARLGFSDDPRWRTHTADPRWVMQVTTGEDGVKRCTFDIVMQPRR